MSDITNTTEGNESTESATQRKPLTLAERKARYQAGLRKVRMAEARQNNPEIAELEQQLSSVKSEYGLSRRIAGRLKVGLKTQERKLDEQRQKIADANRESEELSARAEDIQREIDALVASLVSSDEDDSEGDESDS